MSGILLEKLDFINGIKKETAIAIFIIPIPKKVNPTLSLNLSYIKYKIANPITVIKKLNK
ncbi:hypothetical protein [Flavobacterium sp.]|uniref:hypothetical protein n=1 Tax=Flavobacterium sp. TaxID=239 RepID=UPI003F69E07F